MKLTWPLLWIFLLWVLIVSAVIWGGTWFILGLIFTVVFLFFSVRILTPNTIATVEFLWGYNRIIRQWFHLIVPFLEWTRTQQLFRKNFSVEVEWVTHDTVTAYIWLNVIYYVHDDGNDSVEWNVYKSIYSIDDPRTMIKSAIDEQLRWMMIEFTHKSIFEKREEIGNAIEERLREKLNQFGYKLDSIQVRDVKLATSVMEAMNRVVETQKLKEAAFNEAEAKKIMQVKNAEAEKESKVLLWQGMAWQRMEIAKWFKESIDEIKKVDETLTWDVILKFLLDSARIETLWNIWSRDGTKLIYLNESLEGNTEKLVAWSDIMRS